MSLISLVIPCYNEQDVFPTLQKELIALADRLAEDHAFEFILVDDGSRDNTWQLITQFATIDNRVRAYRLSRNFGHQAALTCGYDETLGDAVVCMDADMQDPPEVIIDMIREWKAGADIVLAVRNRREGETRFKLITASIFYRLLAFLSDIDLPHDVGDFRLMSRRALDAFNKLGEKRRYIRGMVAWIGFNVVAVKYDRKPRRAGTTKYSLAKMVSFAADGLLSFSLAPLRLAFAFAIAGAMPILLYLAYSFTMHILFHSPFQRGWASIMLTVTVFGVLNLFCLGIVGEYVGRLYYEAKGRPIYIVSDVTCALPDEALMYAPATKEM